MAEHDDAPGMLQRAWRRLPAGPRRRLLARGAAMLAPRPDLNPPDPVHGIAVAGEIGRASGLGEGARLMLRAAESLGVPCWRMAASLTGGRGADETGGSLPPRGVPLILHVNPPFLPATLLRLPRGLIRGRRVIGLWAWELPVTPPLWREGAGFVHEAWVPSHFVASAVERLLPGRIRVVPHPVAAAPPEPSALDRAAFGLPADAVVVLTSFSLASSFARKNPLGVIAAHRAAFGERTDRILLLKIGDPTHFPADFAILREAVAGAPNIRLETRTLPAADSHALTRAADILLSLHRSEGFGLVPAEAMLLGVPVVATGWSGNMEYMDAESACLVPFRLVPARDPRGVFEAPGAEWAQPEIPAAAAHLVRLAENAALRAEIGGRGRIAARARLGTAPLEAALAAIGAL